MPPLSLTSMDANDSFIQIYQTQATSYHEMITFEDVDGNLCQSLESVTSFSGKKILDLGTGTGRIPLLFPDAKVVGLDFHHHMLRENQRQQLPEPGPLLQGDMRALPFSSESFEIITAGWAIGHFTGWFAKNWMNQITTVVMEIERVIKTGGWCFILETLTTGSQIPAPPNPALAAYYGWMESVLGFSRQVVQTDYLFNDLDQAIHYTKFFFGEELAKKVRMEKWVRLPEWTGIWSKQY